MLDVRENLVYLYQLLSASTSSFLIERAYGLGATHISRGREQKSVSRETTVNPFVAKMEDICGVFKGLAEVLERDLIIGEEGEEEDEGRFHRTKLDSAETPETLFDSVEIDKVDCPVEEAVEEAVEDDVEINDDQYLLELQDDEKQDAPKDQHQRQRALHISIKLKSTTFNIETHGKILPFSICLADDIYRAACSLLTPEIITKHAGFRLVGIRYIRIREITQRLSDLTAVDNTGGIVKFLEPKEEGSEEGWVCPSCWYELEGLILVGRECGIVKVSWRRLCMWRSV
jgi:hypothetical protein